MRYVRYSCEHGGIGVKFRQIKAAARQGGGALKYRRRTLWNPVARRGRRGWRGWRGRRGRRGGFGGSASRELLGWPRVQRYLDLDEIARRQKDRRRGERGGNKEATGALGAHPLHELLHG